MASPHPQDWPPVGHFLNYRTVFQPVQLQEHDTFSNDGLARCVRLAICWPFSELFVTVLLQEYGAFSNEDPAV